MKKRLYGALLLTVCSCLLAGGLYGNSCVASAAMDGKQMEQVLLAKAEEEVILPGTADALSGQETVIEIRTPEELTAMAENPSGSYRLMADLDMTGVSWKPAAFSGSFDGNGYAVLNLEITETGEGIEDTWDGNMKGYETRFAGLFDTLKGAAVKNLQLINLRIDVDTEWPCFIGGIAGYMEDSVIENCSIQGFLQLKACDRMFGVGGMAGYGSGEIKDTTADVTLVCIDTDATTKDEQFMGGVCAAGYPDIHGCSVNIAGFDSDHGYVHDGGLVGMYMFYPRGTKYYGSITDNLVTGKITFFEDNKNRRAYCTGFIGEIMNWDFENGRNKADFVRDERFEYDVNLLPHNCQEPVWTEELTEPVCDSFGYTTRSCSCGYTETYAYTLKSHSLEWQVTKEPSYADEGVETAVCRNCDYTEERAVPVLAPTPSPEPENTPEPEAVENMQPEEKTAEENGILRPVLMAVLLLTVCMVVVILVVNKKKR